MKSLIKRNNNVLRNRTWDPFFDDFFSAPAVFGRWMDSNFVPRVNIRETKDGLYLDFEVPGIDKNDVKVMVKDNVLTVSGNREDKGEAKEDNFVRREIMTGSFTRQFTLPDSVNTDSIKAEYKNGILYVSFDKVEEAKPKEIEVKVS